MTYEDTLTGSADITGDPQPTRPMTKNEQNSAVKREVNRAGPGKPKPSGHGKGQPKQKQEGQQEGGGEGEEQAQQQGPMLHPGLSQALQQNQQQGNPLSGQDWFAHTKDSAELSYYAAQELGQLISAVFKVGGPDFSPPNHINRLQAKAASLKGKPSG